MTWNDAELFLLLVGLPELLHFVLDLLQILLQFLDFLFQFRLKLPDLILNLVYQFFDFRQSIGLLLGGPCVSFNR